jgi:hypothetical protein
VSGKKLRTDGVVSELAAGSVFFQQGGAAARPAEAVSPPPPEADSARASTNASSHDSEQAGTSESMQESDRAVMQDSNPERMQDSRPALGLARMADRRHESTSASKTAGALAASLAESDDLVDAIYRVVRRPGKEIAYVRLTDREKSAVGQLLTSIGQDHGFKVSETELIRIAVCALLADHAQHEDDSMLMHIVRALKD